MIYIMACPLYVYYMTWLTDPDQVRMYITNFNGWSHLGTTMDKNKAKIFLDPYEIPGYGIEEIYDIEEK